MCCGNKSQVLAHVETAAVTMGRPWRSIAFCVWIRTLRIVTCPTDLPRGAVVVITGTGLRALLGCICPPIKLILHSYEEGGEFARSKVGTRLLFTRTRTQLIARNFQISGPQQIYLLCFQKSALPLQQRNAEFDGSEHQFPACVRVCAARIHMCAGCKSHPNAANLGIPTAIRSMTIFKPPTRNICSCIASILP